MIWTNVRFQNLCHNIKRSQQCQKKKKKLYMCVCMYLYIGMKFSNGSIKINKKLFCLCHFDIFQVNSTLYLFVRNTRRSKIYKI